MQRPDGCSASSLITFMIFLYTNQNQTSQTKPQAKRKRKARQDRSKRDERILEVKIREQVRKGALPPQPAPIDLE